LQTVIQEKPVQMIEKNFVEHVIFYIQRKLLTFILFDDTIPEKISKQGESTWKNKDLHARNLLAIPPISQCPPFSACRRFFL